AARVSGGAGGAAPGPGGSAPGGHRGRGAGWRGGGSIRVGASRSVMSVRGSVTELPDAGEHHREAQPIGGGCDLVVLDGAARLNDRPHPGRSGLFYPVGERKERVGS